MVLGPLSPGTTSSAPLSKHLVCMVSPTSALLEPGNTVLELWGPGPLTAPWLCHQRVKSTCIYEVTTELQSPDTATHTASLLAPLSRAEPTYPPEGPQQNGLWGHRPTHTHNGPTPACPPGTQPAPDNGLHLAPRLLQPPHLELGVPPRLLSLLLECQDGSPRAPSRPHPRPPAPSSARLTGPPSP